MTIQYSVPELSSEDVFLAMDILNNYLLAEYIFWNEEEQSYIGIAADGTEVNLGAGNPLLTYLLENPTRENW